jgi:Zn-dependent protease with chaperone function
MARPELPVDREAQKRAGARGAAGGPRGQSSPESRRQSEARQDDARSLPETRDLDFDDAVAGRDGSHGPTRAADSAAQGPPTPLSGLMLLWRNGVLRLLESMYWTVTFAGSMAILVLGGFVPVARGWLRNEIDGWPEVVATLGGAWFAVDTQDPDSDLGPVLARVDAPQLFTTIDTVGRRLGVKPPGQVRLSYLPCCGVVAWGRSRALLIGLPLFRVLTQGELRAIVAHELAHLARGDATQAARSARFVAGLAQAVERNGPRLWGPLGAWARYCLREGSWLIEPVARGQEARADRCAAALAGGSAASSALVKVAVVQPLFREVLECYDPNEPGSLNLYAFFRTFWYRLPPEVHSAMRLSALANGTRTCDPAHPPLPDRIASLQSYPDPVSSNGESMPATTFLGDLEVFEQMLHNRLFNLPVVEPSVFHRAGS